MSYYQNSEDICNNPNCREPIWWNKLVTHPDTGRPRPLNHPYYPDTGVEASLHLCMRDKKPGMYINKYELEDRMKEEEDFLKSPLIPKPPVGVKVGITHLYYNGEFKRFLKCPYCKFRNIHEETITHHIKFTSDKIHSEVDVETLDRSSYIVLQ